jgi:hypothetical protein
MTIDNTLRITGFGLLLCLGSSLASAQPVPAAPKFDKSNPAKYGTALAQYAEDFDSGWLDSYAKSKMTLTDQRGDKVVRETRQLILEGDNGDKSIVRFMSPAEIRGVAALTHEHPKGTDDSWLYLPSSRRVRRISGANRTSSFQGTEFTYEDLSSVETDDYDWKFLAEETIKVAGKSHAVYKLEAKPNYKDTGYSKIIVYVNKKLWRAEQTEFFDKAGRKLKILSLSKWSHIHKRFWRPGKLEMVNQQTHKKTAIESDSLFLNMSKYKKKDGSARNNLKDSAFTRRALESS